MRWLALALALLPCAAYVDPDAALSCSARALAALAAADAELGRAATAGGGQSAYDAARAVASAEPQCAAGALVAGRVAARYSQGGDAEHWLARAAAAAPNSAYTCGFLVLARAMQHSAGLKEVSAAADAAAAACEAGWKGTALQADALAPSRLVRGAAALARAHHAAAAALLRQAVAGDLSSWPDPWFLLGLAHQRSGAAGDAATAFFEAARLDDPHPAVGAALQRLSGGETGARTHPTPSPRHW